MTNSGKDRAQCNESVSSQAEFTALIHKGRAGDQDAVGKLLSKYRNYLLLIANQDLDNAIRAKLGASDVVQQSMILAQQNFEQFRGESEPEFLGWLRTILVNDIRNHRRQYTTLKRDAGMEISMQDQSTVQHGLTDRNNTPQSDALLNELAIEMERCLEQLSESHRQVIRLRNWQEKPFAEIGDTMNCSSDAARKLWFRAFNRLKDVVLKSRPEFASHMMQISDVHSRKDVN